MPSTIHLIRSLIDAVLPPMCPLCGGNVPPADGETAGCIECAAKIPLIEAYCPRCSAPVPAPARSERGCGHCHRNRFAFDGVFAVGEYRDVLQDAVRTAKAARGGPAAAWLADRLWERRGAELRSLAIDLIVPVPQHWLRRLAGPHNAAELISRRLALRLKAPVGRHILQKTRRTPAQANLPPSGRRTNLRNAFRATRPLDGRRVLLVDDVLTTGTTSDRSARALRAAGAATVWVAVAARGIGK